VADARWTIVQKMTTGMTILISAMNMSPRNLTSWAASGATRPKITPATTAMITEMYSQCVALLDFFFAAAAAAVVAVASSGGWGLLMTEKITPVRRGTQKVFCDYCPTPPADRV
jgi:hypothetical protein